VRGSGFAEPPEPPFSTGSAIGANPSFADLLRSTRPEAAPHVTAMPPEMTPTHGTTVIGLKYAEGIVMAGDRRATEGYAIADDRIEKVFPADEHSTVAIAGAAGQAVEIVKLLQVELEHYEKVQGDKLSLEGKANRLAQLIRQNFPLALQGLIVVPIFGGFDLRREIGRLFRYDATGGRWEEEDYMSTGSGGRPAKSSLKKLWRPGLSREEAVRVAVEALRDAAQEDVATGGPDPTRGIYPLVKIVSASGVEDVPNDEVRRVYEAMVAEEQSHDAGSGS
jgi:proteasome beta subunit